MTMACSKGKTSDMPGSLITLQWSSVLLCGERHLLVPSQMQGATSVLVGTAVHLESSWEDIFLLRDKEHIYSCLCPLCFLQPSVNSGSGNLLRTRLNWGPCPPPDRARGLHSSKGRLGCSPDSHTPPGWKTSHFACVVLGLSLLFCSECFCRSLSLTPVI